MADDSGCSPAQGHYRAASAALAHLSLRSPGFPLWLCWCGTIALVGAAFVVRYALFGATSILPHSFFFPAVIAAAALFGRGCGLAAALLSTILADYFFVAPHFSLDLLAPDGALGALVFLGSAGIVAAMVEALRAAHVRTEAARAEGEAARARAEAGEREKDVLLAELGHRVKNDLARLTSLLRVQAATAAPEAAEALRAAAERASVVGRLHDRLVRREGDVAVDARDFLSGLVEDLCASLGGLRPVGLFVEAEPHALPLSCASAVGLVANEFVTNALKHAFPGERAGSISVTFRREGTEYVLSVADDGVGIGVQEPVWRPSSAPGGMGRRLVRALAAQCGGRIDSLPQVPRGTLQILRFPVSRTTGGDACRSNQGKGRGSLTTWPEAA